MWCDLEVQVNEEHTFHLRQKPLATYSGKMSRILKRTLSRTAGPRILLHDFPGGAEGFEMAVRFCYSGGRIDIHNSNVSVLRCVGEFLEMTEACARGNLVKVTEMHLQNLGNEWDGNLTVLRGCCGSVLELAEKAHIVHRCADALASRICSTLEDSSSPASSSPDSYRFHSGSISRGSFSSGVSRTWWFSDVASLSVFLMERVVKSLIYNDMDNRILARFLIHYLRSALPVHVYNGANSSKEETGIREKVAKKVQLTVFEVIVNLFFHLERGSTSCRFLFSMLRVSGGLNASRSCRRQLEKMIGSQLHEASLDNILLPLYPRSSSLYDVDLVVRLADSFFKEQEVRGSLEEKTASLEATVETPATRVGDLIDRYLAEIAPDMYLKVHKFRRLAQALPASARWNHDELYRAVDSFLEAHSDLVEEEVIALCKVIDIEKLSFEACKHAAKNPRLPAKFVLEVLAFQQGQLRDCFIKERDSQRIHRRSVSENIITEPSRESQLRLDLNEMSFKVNELEKACKSMRSDVTKYNRAARRLMC